MAVPGNPWLSFAPRGPPWPCLAFLCPPLPFLAVLGPPWPSLAFPCLSHAPGRHQIPPERVYLVAVSGLNWGGGPGRPDVHSCASCAAEQCTADPAVHAPRARLCQIWIELSRAGTRKPQRAQLCQLCSCAIHSRPSCTQPNAIADPAVQRNGRTMCTAALRRASERCIAACVVKEARMRGWVRSA